eukprot:6428278-Amphidinium_carterae.1
MAGGMKAFLQSLAAKVSIVEGKARQLNTSEEATGEVAQPQEHAPPLANGIVSLRLWQPYASLSEEVRVVVHTLAVAAPDLILTDVDNVLTQVPAQEQAKWRGATIDEGFKTSEVCKLARLALQA